MLNINLFCIIDFKLDHLFEVELLPFHLDHFFEVAVDGRMFWHSFAARRLTGRQVEHADLFRDVDDFLFVHADQRVIDREVDIVDLREHVV